jgi:hypothetical protein
METSSKKTQEITHSLFWGTLILLIGATLLGVNLGYVNAGVWENLMKLWPVLLIIWGLNIVFRHTYLQFFSYLSPLLLIGAFAYAVTTAPYTDSSGDFIFPGIFFNDSQITNAADYNYKFADDKKNPEVKSVDVKLELGASKLELGPAPPETFAIVDISSNAGSPNVTFKLEGSVLKLYGASASSRNIRHSKDDWTVTLPPNYPTAIDVDSGAADCKLDLRQFNLTSLSVDAGASSLTLSLPAPAATYTVSVSSGASSIKFKLPTGAPIQIRSDSAVTSANFKGAGLVKDGDYWRSAGFDPSKPFVDVEVSAGASSLNLSFEEPAA